MPRSRPRGGPEHGNCRRSFSRSAGRQPGTPPLPVLFPRTGQAGDPRMTIPDAITGKPGDTACGPPGIPLFGPGCYPVRDPEPALPPGGPPPGPPPLAPGMTAMPDHRKPRHCTPIPLKYPHRRQEDSDEQAVHASARGGSRAGPCRGRRLFRRDGVPAGVTQRSGGLFPRTRISCSVATMC